MATSVSSSTPESVTVRRPVVTVTVVCGSAASCAAVYASGEVTSPLTASTGRGPAAEAGTALPTEARTVTTAKTGIQRRTTHAPPPASRPAGAEAAAPGRLNPPELVLLVIT